MRQGNRRPGMIVDSRGAVSQLAKAPGQLSLRLNRAGRLFAARHRRQLCLLEPTVSSGSSRHGCSGLLWVRKGCFTVTYSNLLRPEYQGRSSELDLRHSGISSSTRPRPSSTHPRNEVKRGMPRPNKACPACLKKREALQKSPFSPTPPRSPHCRTYRTPRPRRCRSCPRRRSP